MGTDKRARQKAGRQERIEAAYEAQQRADRRARILRIVGFFVVIVAIAAALAWFRKDDTDTAATTDESTSSVSDPTATTGVSLPAVPAGASVTGDTPCPPADGSAVRTSVFEKAPPMCIDVAKTYTAVMSTTKGDLTITLDPKSAPKAVNNFVVLARYHYYDGVPFHRIIPGFVVQGGDPTASGTGDPGYSFEDELPAAATVYQPGTMAMANSGANTNGSQFFIVLAADKLQANYSVFGQVTQGFDTTVQALAAVGTADGKPSEVVSINTVTITES